MRDTENKTSGSKKEALAVGKSKNMLGGVEGRLCNKLPQTFINRIGNILRQSLRSGSPQRFAIFMI